MTPRYGRVLTRPRSVTQGLGARTRRRRWSMMAGVVMAAAAVLVVMVLVGARVHRRHVMVRATIAGVDELTRLIATWESQHRPRRRALEQHMTDIELRVTHAEDS